MQDFQDEIDRLENTNAGRRAGDAGSAQQGNLNTSCCGGWHQRSSLQSSKMCGIDERSSRQALLQREVRNLQEWGARLSAEVEREEDKLEAGGQHTGPAAAEGTSQAASPVTSTDWQGK